MKTIDKIQVLDWLSKKEFLGSNNNFLIPDFDFSYHFEITKDSGTKTSISRELGALIKNYSGESLLWINEYGIWPSCEDVNLFTGFRKSIGEKESVYMKPGHLFQTEDIDNIQSIIAMVLYFVWGAIILTEPKDMVIRISHDEYITIYSKEDINVSRIKDICETNN